MWRQLCTFHKWRHLVSRIPEYVTLRFSFTVNWPFLRYYHHLKIYVTSTLHFSKMTSSGLQNPEGRQKYNTSYSNKFHVGIIFQFSSKSVIVSLSYSTVWVVDLTERESERACWMERRRPFPKNVYNFVWNNFFANLFWFARVWVDITSLTQFATKSVE